MRARRILAPLAGVALALALWPATWPLDASVREGGLGPGFWPRLALLGLGLACLARTVGAWRHARAGGGEPPPPIARLKLAIGIALVVGYALAAPSLGFPLTTAAFIAAFMLLAGARSPLGVGAAAALGTVGLVYLFVKVVYLPLPKGDGPFETLTLAVYRALRVF
jgi:putative tricarboxylic transport membrane protein